MTRKLLFTAAAVGLIGAGLIGYSFTLPFYTDPAAPSRLSSELHPGQIAEWYARLAAYETPRKALFNWGQGLLSLGLAIGTAIGVLGLYLRNPRFRNAEAFFIGWN
ncbi:MAG TPA: hypothetical protein VIS74_03160, partial [Chthoniobacterales bacterium]